MRTQQILLGGLLAAMLAGGPLVARAADTPPAAQSRKAWCQANPEQCEQARAKRTAFCQANPDTCKAQRERFKAKRDEIRTQCAAKPDQCEQIKAEARQRFRDERRHRQDQQEARPAG